MLKRRIVAVVVVLDGIAVQSIGFRRYLPLGRPEIAVEFLDRWGVDEIVLTDISASRLERGPDEAMVRCAAEHCNVPLTVAGGISEISHVAGLLACGADKIAINRAARVRCDLITEMANRFGDQCVMASIDAAPDGRGGYRVYDYLTSTILEETPANLARQMQAHGAGEVLLNSVERDGSYRGFDIGLIASVVEAVSVPVIAVGGAGRPSHFVDAFAATGASALGAANMFHFSEHSVTLVKSCLSKFIPIRRDTAFDYSSSVTDPAGRLLKKSDEVLEQMLYVRIEKEVI